VEEQINNFLAYSAPEVSRNIILVGNKTDLAEERQVTIDDAIRLGKKLNLAAVYETSAKDGGEVIDEVFMRAIINCVDIYNNEEELLEGRWQARSRVMSAQNNGLVRKESFQELPSYQNNSNFKSPKNIRLDSSSLYHNKYSTEQTSANSGKRHGNTPARTGTGSFCC
jgi:Fe2+ transport system protein B